MIHGQPWDEQSTMSHLMLRFVSVGLAQENKMLIIQFIFFEQRTIPEAQYRQDVHCMCLLSSTISCTCLLGFLLGSEVLSEQLSTFTH